MVLTSVLIHFDVILTDVNEHRPEFLLATTFTYVFNVSEEIAPIKLSIGSVAYDHDCSDRSPHTIAYIVEPAAFSSYIKIVQDPDFALLFLLIEKAIDRELVDYIELSVCAQDSRGLTSAPCLTVQINVTDLNDNAPKFEKTMYEIELEDNG